MDLPRADIEFAKTYCADFGKWYRGPNILGTGFTLEDPEERNAVVAENWAKWSAFARNYFMAMLHTLGGHKVLDLESQITNFCTPDEALGGRTAIDVFWRRDLSRRGVVKRCGAWSFTHVQFVIFENEEVNAEVFQSVERSMVTAITNTLRTRRNFLKQWDDGEDHDAGFQDDLAQFFGRGRPTRASRNQRNANYDFVLFR